jgi:Kef-type K+ transport system membrane component KefB
MNGMILNMFHKDLDNPVFMFTIVLLIILLSPLLLKKLRIPGIIGLIISGVIFGPYGLNLIERNAAVDLFSTIGLLYLMFIAGLELDLDQFKKNPQQEPYIWLFNILHPTVDRTTGVLLFTWLWFLAKPAHCKHVQYPHPCSLPNC